MRSARLEFLQYHTEGDRKAGWKAERGNARWCRSGTSQWYATITHPLTTILQHVYTQSSIAGYGKVADVPVAAPRRVTVAPHTNVTGVQSVKIRHGPYKVPSMNKENMMGSSGTLYNYPDVQVERPCEG